MRHGRGKVGGIYVVVKMGKGDGNLSFIYIYIMCVCIHILYVLDSIDKWEI